MNKKTTLREAQRLILDLARPTPPETISLLNALGRIPVEHLKSVLPIPSFDSSTRDGFAVKSHDIAKAKAAKPVELKICGEIPAGLTDIPHLGQGQALRIMTGAAVPTGSDLVLAQEDIEIRKRTVIVDRPTQATTHIRRRGCDLSKGRIVVRKGEVIRPAHLGLLATAGVSSLQVHQQPKVAVICTGSELIRPDREPATGQVISSNCLLLAGLVTQCGAIVRKVSIIPDQSREIAAGLQALLTEELPLIITTGGMGPGKFDLMTEVFKKLAIRTVYSSLELRPGRATMLGVSGKSLIMALPGPPPAVQLLFNELARAAIRRINGEARPLGNSCKAELTEPCTIRHGNSLHLTGGVFSIKGGATKVRQARKTESANCVMLLPAGRSRFRAGEKITIHPTQPFG
jgi:molybdopterin molybdotransferase